MAVGAPRHRRSGRPLFLFMPNEQWFIPSAREPAGWLAFLVVFQPLLKVFAAQRHSLARLPDDHGSDQLADPVPGEFEPDGDPRSPAVLKRVHLDVHICPDRPVDTANGPGPGRVDFGNLRRRGPVRPADRPRYHAPGPDVRRSIPLDVPLYPLALPLPEPGRIRDIGKDLLGAPPNLNPRHNLRHPDSSLYVTSPYSQPSARRLLRCSRKARRNPPPSWVGVAEISITN